MFYILITLDFYCIKSSSTSSVMGWMAIRVFETESRSDDQRLRLLAHLLLYHNKHIQQWHYCGCCPSRLCSIFPSVVNKTPRNLNLSCALLRATFLWSRSMALYLAIVIAGANGIIICKTQRWNHVFPEADLLRPLCASRNSVHKNNDRTGDNGQPCWRPTCTRNRFDLMQTRFLLWCRDCTILSRGPPTPYFRAPST